MPKELAAEFANATVVSDGIKRLPLLLSLNLETGEISVQTESGKTILTVPKPKDYDAAGTYDTLLRSWWPFFCWAGDADSCRKALQPERLVLHVWLTDVNDMAAYEKNLLDQQEAAAMATSEPLFSGDSGGGAEALAVYEVNFCGGIPVTAITAVSNTNIRLQWVSQTNDTYAVQYANDMEWFNTWHLIADNITNSPSNAVWDDTGILSTNVTKRFYRVVRKDANYGLPCVTILSPTNAATMNGNAVVQVYATDDSRISVLTLMVDGADFATISAGPMSFPLPTTFFTNGVHTLAVRAADNAGILNLGGDPNSPVVANVTTSQPVQVTFQNDITVTWFEGFQSSLPIQARLTSTNADWTITIKNEGGTTVKTYSGSTSGGQINVTWDGTDNSSTPVPSDAAYFVTVSATPTGLAPLSTSSSATFASYREQFVGTMETLLVRQKFIRPDVQAAAIGRLENIKNWIALAEFNADVYLGAVQQIAVNSDWDDLLNYLKDPPPRDITQFYYYGHSGPLALGFRETTPDKGITQGDVAIVTSNFLTWASVPVPHYRTPYKFVFIDGCEAAQGDWSEAFGIKKAQVNYAFVGRKNRAFMGWQHIVIADFLFSIHYGNFTTGFWQYWTEDVTRTLADAVDLAFADEPLVALSELKIYGNSGVTWGE
jgi:Bacterial Ig domain/FlgD Ig-like domain